MDTETSYDVFGLSPITCLFRNMKRSPLRLGPCTVDAATFQTVGKRAVPVVEFEDRLVVVHGQVCESDRPPLGITLEVEVGLNSIPYRVLWLFGRWSTRPS